MTTHLLWWSGPALEFLILLRAARGGFIKKYPFFYSYVFCVLVIDCISNPIHASNPTHYAIWYWSTQFLILIVGYGIILEISNHALEAYPGAERCSRYLVIALFAIIFAYVALQGLLSAHWSPAATSAELERDLRVVQALLLVSILFVVSYFRIALGKNLKGIILGYGLFLGTSVMILAIQSYAGKSFQAIWDISQPFFYVASLMIWTVALWSYQPNPEPAMPPALEADYRVLAMKTKGMLHLVRASLGKATRL